MNNPVQFLSDLYRDVAHFACDSGCSACCKGVVSLALPELLAIEVFCGERGGIGQVVASASPTGCPFRTDAGCPIYPVRPFMCRLFGFRFFHPDLTGQPFCPRKTLIRPGDIEAQKYKSYIQLCEERGFVLIGQPRDPAALPAAIEENRAMAARFPEIERFAPLLAGNGQ